MAERKSENLTRIQQDQNPKEKSTFEQAAEVKIATTEAKKEILPKLGGG